MVNVCLFSEDSSLQLILSSALGKDFRLQLQGSANDVCKVVAAGECDVVLVDLDADQNIEQRLRDCQRIIASQAPSIILVDDRIRAKAAELVRLGAYGYTRKPPSIRDLNMMLCRAHENASMRRQLNNLQTPINDPESQCDRMIGSSSPMQQVYDLVRRVASINTSVLITGESGTGKELIAQAIHNMGTRSRRQFVAVCCGAIPETLIEAELFGHEKGAYTGTAGSREGYLERVGDGTLLLDEIGELSLSTQVKLLRVLQQREFCRLGSTRVIPLRARVIFATHQNLEIMVKEGRFRQDLFYRINVMRIDAPSLRDHADDIPTIARYFLRQYSDQYGKIVDEIESQAMALLQGYTWPGNVRELENVIQRSIIMCQGTKITISDLPVNIVDEAVPDVEDCLATSSFERQIREFKFKLAADAVREHHGNKTLAARSLQISRAYLHRLIRPTDSILPEEEPSAQSSQSEPLGLL